MNFSEGIHRFLSNAQQPSLHGVGNQSASGEKEVRMSEMRAKFRHKYG